MWSTNVENIISPRNSFGLGPHFCQQNKHIMKGHAGKKSLDTNSLGLATELSLISKLLQKVIPKKKFCLLVQDTPWFYCLVKLLVHSFWHFETNTHNKQGLIEDTSVSFLCDFMTVFTKWKYANVCKIEIANYRFLFWHISILQITDFHFANYRFLFCKSFWRIREWYCNYFNSILLQLFSL